MNRILVILIALFCITQLRAQQEGPDLRRGNKEYKHENYTEAEVNYRRGLDKNNDSFEGHFNLGDALFRQEKYPEALEQYQKAESRHDRAQSQRARFFRSSFHRQQLQRQSAHIRERQMLQGEQPMLDDEYVF